MKLCLGKKKVDCELYMFDHGEFTAGRQAWLDGDKVGALQIHEAIATIARRCPKSPPRRYSTAGTRCSDSDDSEAGRDCRVHANAQRVADREVE